MARKPTEYTRPEDFEAELEAALQRKESIWKRINYGAVALVITLVATAAATIFNGSQWLTARNQEHAQLQAYVGPETETFTILCISCATSTASQPPAGSQTAGSSQAPAAPANPAQKYWEFSFGVKNYGATPAYDVSVCQFNAVLPILAGELAVEEHKSSNLTEAEGVSADQQIAAFHTSTACREAQTSDVWPNEEHHYTIAFFGNTENMLLSVRQQKTRMLVFEEIRYVDIFQKHHVTWFCRDYSYPGRDMFQGYNNIDVPKDY